MKGVTINFMYKGIRLICSSVTYTTKVFHASNSYIHVRVCKARSYRKPLQLSRACANIHRFDLLWIICWQVRVLLVVSLSFTGYTAVLATTAGSFACCWIAIINFLHQSFVTSSIIFCRTSLPLANNGQHSASSCAPRVTDLRDGTVVVLCVCPGLTSATTRPSRHTYGLSIVLAPESIWRFSYNGLAKIAIALP